LHRVSLSLWKEHTIPNHSSQQSVFGFHDESWGGLPSSFFILRRYGFSYGLHLCESDDEEGIFELNRKERFFNKKGMSRIRRGSNKWCCMVNVEDQTVICIKINKD
jgi:hypothetical protein